MQLKKSSLFYLVAGFVILTFLGFVREYVFEGINEYLGQLYYNYEKPTIRKGLEIFTYFSYWPLYYLKFALTFFFTVIYFFISYFFLKMIFVGHLKIGFFTAIFFSTVFSFSLAFYFFSFLGSPETFYNISRRLAEIVQSPMAFMLLFPAFLLMQKTK